MGDYKESNTLQDHILSLSQERRPRSFFEGRRRLYTGHLWIADVNRVPVYNCINYFCLFFLWPLKRCWQTTTLLFNFTTQDRHMKPVYRRPLMSVHRLAEKKCRSLFYCRGSRVDGSMSRVEGTMSRVIFFFNFFLLLLLFNYNSTWTFEFA